MKRLLRIFWYTIKDRTQLREDTDYQSTVSSISNSVVFRGMNVWILAFAIIVASVGLNVNSTAVIIGAMLISPLMGPINGIGLAIGISDEDLLRTALKNLVFMVFISLAASTLYFLISPLSDAQSELLARTRPSIFDVFIAFFGGLAGIIATSRKSQSITVISGVAIATALMPPLCTAGFGLATAQFRYFFGAFYLFFINSFFIALSTFVMVRFLGFPMKKYVDEKRSRNVKRLISIFTIIVLVPSVIMAIDVVREAAFNAQAIKFTNDIQDSENFTKTQIVHTDREYHHKGQTITLSLIGMPLSNEDIYKLQKQLQEKYGLKHTKLIIRQTGEAIDITKQNAIIEDIIAKKDETIDRQDSTIIQLRSQLSNVRNAAAQSEQITKEVYAQYPDIVKFAISEMESYNTKTLEHTTIPVVYVQWKDNKPHEQSEKQLLSWLKIRLNIKEIKLIR